MNEKPNNPNDEKLRAVLREWNVTASLPPRFQEQVWNRIERQSAEVPDVSISSFVVDWLKRSVARPAFAVAYAAILLMVGLTGGFLRAQQENAKLDSMIETRYVQSLDPYQK